MSQYYIGLMSGTSLDSVDAVLVRFEPEFELLAWHEHALPEPQRQSILQLTQPGDNEIEHLGLLDRQLGELFADAVNTLLERSGTDPADIIAIGSHGQTIRHRPEKGFSLQIGDPASIAEHTGITTLADFRRRDLAAGGQGAPLVPPFHEHLFRSHKQDRVLVNLGGMANITLLPASPQQDVSGYDTGPGNVLMDTWIQRQQGKAFDRHGDWARSGQVIEKLLDSMLSDAYFHQPPPKSTGRETFNSDWLERAIARLTEAPRAEDVQATLLELTARSLADAIQTHSLHQPELYLCGGGSHNQGLHQRLQQLLPDSQINTTEVLGLHPDWMEATAFAWFAMRTLNRKTASRASVTGARGDRILGAIHLP
ncbi:anhydro-N-acetylmuramic acid kinase [Marinobacterium stanieri]|uniref:anhydro-N-acetylmuramic acid kinase n=1 Tax=Marinobacterium stanieri TaxID=49186 RepID=UPI003A8F9F72